VKRKEGGRGLLQIEVTYKAEMTNIADNLKTKCTEYQFSMFHCAFLNSIVDKHQHMHISFNTIIVYNVDFIKIHKNI